MEPELIPLTELKKIADDRDNSWIKHKSQYNNHELGWKTCEKNEYRERMYFNGWTNTKDQTGEYDIFMYPVQGTAAYDYSAFDRNGEPNVPNNTDYPYKFAFQWYDVFIKKSSRLGN